MSNKQWAFTEAARRSVALEQPYSIYQLDYTDDFIIRAAAAAAPGKKWERVATFTDGKLTFGAGP